MDQGKVGRTSRSKAVESRTTGVRVPLGRVEISEARTEVGRLAVKMLADG